MCTVFYLQLLVINVFLYIVPLQQSFSTCGPGTSRTHIMGALVRNANSQVSIRKLWEWDSEIQVLRKISGRFWCFLKFENHGFMHGASVTEIAKERGKFPFIQQLLYAKVLCTLYSWSHLLLMTRTSPEINIVNHKVFTNDEAESQQGKWTRLRSYD